MIQAAKELDDCWNKIGTAGDGSCPELKKVVHCHNCPVHADAGRSLLDRDAPADYRHEWTQLLARQKEQSASATQSSVIFTLGSEDLALPTPVFREVTEVREIHRMPGRRNKYLMGLVSVRGEIQLCFSLELLLGLESVIPKKPAQLSDGRMMVLEHGGDSWVFPVTKVHGTYKYDASSIKPVAATLQKGRASFTSGELEWDGKTVGCLNESALFAAVKRGFE